MPRVRQNIITNEWVVVAPERFNRPEHHAEKMFSSEMKHVYPCAFCHGQVAWHQRYTSLDTKDIYVIPNTYPAFQDKDELEAVGHGFYNDSHSYGDHEVIVLKDPRDKLNTLKSAKLYELLKVMQGRLQYHQKETEHRFFIPIYNHGRDSGASMAHPHAQFFGSDVVSPRLERELGVTKNYYDDKKECVFCQMIKFEQEEQSRVIYHSDEAIAITAFAPRYPFETWILPLHHSMSFAEANEKSLEGMAKAMHHVFEKFDQKLSNPSLNWFIHTTRSIDKPYEESFHWHIEITPRLGKQGGFELGSDTSIQIILPEAAAKLLR